MDILLEEIRKGLDYLYSQGKRVNEIKMNPNLLDNMTNQLKDVDVSKGVSTLFDIPIQADENIEKYAFILDKVT